MLGGVKFSLSVAPGCHYGGGRQVWQLCVADSVFQKYQPSGSVPVKVVMGGDFNSSGRSRADTPSDQLDGVAEVTMAVPAAIFPWNLK